MKPFVFVLLLACLLLPYEVLGAEGFLYFEGTAATVNKEVIFLSDLLFEQCLLRCGALPESMAEELSLHEARERLISEMLALQENEKLALGQTDNVALAEQVREAEAKLASCESPCGRDISGGWLAKWVERKLVIRGFLHDRVGIFVDVSEEDARKELERMVAHTGSVAGLSIDEVRRKVREEKIAKEVRNWRMRAASKATITLSPLEEK
ncbi:MAG: hypothetical protein FWF95_02930 [Syntrophorhabdaceae bacterium]|nr:hypothetical protein [Syntrophorhabdaceae bacterium]